MTTPMPKIYDHYLRGSQRITNRWNACNCGCQGSDPWHKRFMRRTVQNVTVLDALVEVATRNYADRYGKILIAARGVARHPAEERRLVPIGLEAVVHDGRACTLGWVYLAE